MKLRTHVPARLGLAGLAAMVGAALPAGAQTAPASAASQVYRCPGPPVLYTDALSPQEARDRGCRSIEGTPITIIQARPRAPAAAASPAGTTTTTQRPGDSRVDPAAQRQRDSEARRILQDELRKEEERLAVILKEYNNGEPERRGDERNYQRYLDRVADMKAGITRKEADIAALKREIAKLPNP